VIDTWIPVHPVHAEVQEIDAVADGETERAADVQIVFVVSLSLLALFIVTFVSYLVLDAAHLAIGHVATRLTQATGSEIV
jgi:hypothetical protein